MAEFTAADDRPRLMTDEEEGMSGKRFEILLCNPVGGFTLLFATNWRVVAWVADFAFGFKYPRESLAFSAWERAR